MSKVYYSFEEASKICVGKIGRRPSLYNIFCDAWDSGLEVCNFSYEYYDYGKMQRIRKRCEVEAGNNGLCIFHDPDYLNDQRNNLDREEEVRRRFREILDSKNSRSEPIICIGYNLPSTDLGLIFTSDVYFDSTTFNGLANFSESTFQKVANFYKCTFKKMANFSKSQFNNRANFNDVSFLAQIAIFDHVQFNGIASFGSTKFLCGVNFSQTKFFEKTNFFETRFYDLAIFYGVEFHDEANFAQSKFLRRSTEEPCDRSEESVLGRSIFLTPSYVDSLNSMLNSPPEIRNMFLSQSFESLVNFGEVKWFKTVGFQSATFEVSSDFSNTSFFLLADFTNSDIVGGCRFLNSIFGAEVKFVKTRFAAEVLFENVSFERPERVKIIVENLSNVSFINTDITRVFFPTYARWGDPDNFKIFSNRLMENEIANGKKIDTSIIENVSSMYRSLRENYEFRLRYEEAGRFFTKEMDLKRKYRTSPSVHPCSHWIKKRLALKHAKSDIPPLVIEVKKNSWLRSHFFSLIALYWFFSTYGESIAKPTILGLVIIALSSLLWITQSNPLLQPNFYSGPLPIHFKESNFVGFDQIWNVTHWSNSFQRSMADFLPIINISGEFREGIFDYTIKVISGALVFGLLAIALRRKFERKYTR